MRQSLHSNDQGRCPLHSHHPHRAWPGSLTERPILTHQEEPPREPLEEIQVDFKDSGIPAAPSGEGKKQHVVEAMNFVDAGTSVLLAAKVQDDFRAHTALEAIIDFLREHGCPPRLSIDHDPRWVGGPGGWDFPSALLRFLAAVGDISFSSTASILEDIKQAEIIKPDEVPYCCQSRLVVPHTNGRGERQSDFPRIMGLGSL